MSRRTCEAGGCRRRWEFDVRLYPSVPNEVLSCGPCLVRVVTRVAATRTSPWEAVRVTPLPIPPIEPPPETVHPAVGLRPVFADVGSGT